MFQKFVLSIIWIIIIGISFITWTSFQNRHKNTEILKIQNENTKQHETIADIEIQKNIKIETSDIILTKDTYEEYMEFANVAENNNQLNTAIEYYKKAITKKENDINALNKLANVYSMNNQYTEALSTLNKIKELKNSTNNSIKIIKTLLALNEIKAAKKILWEIDQNNITVKYYQGIIYLIYNKLDDAKKIFTEISKINNNENDSIIKDIQEKTEHFLKAYKTFSYYIDENEIHLKTLLAKAMTENKEYRPSIYILEQIIKEKANYRDAWTIMGYAYLNLNQTKEAIDALNRAKKIDPQKPETLFFLGLAYFNNNDIDQAIANIELADKNGFKQKDQIKLKLGDLYAINNRFKDSEKIYSELLEINQNNIEVFTRIVWLNIDKLNNTEKALKIANKATQIHPQNAMSYNLMGWALIAQKNYTQAEGYITKSLELDDTLAVANLNLGIIYEKTNRFDLAKESYKNAYINGKNTPVEATAATRFNKIEEKEKNNFILNEEIL